ncbi:ejaculatory bulb-specific protein 3-like [Schistocerca gregaria]|uniref:ejaculatory bulb-specific protein 3-like n=1 Tax=Schistocerca gregaria TaxID=7010 RepID=UPI00211DEA55|nr:ejaculatory bulb-specific protein 3-like [Schistocerca gregaria]
MAATPRAAPLPQLLLLALVLLAPAVRAAAAAAPLRTPLDRVDVDKLLASARLVEAHLRCVLENRDCNADGRALRDVIPRVLKTGCNDCTERQRHNATRVICFLIKSRPRDWARLVAHYDDHGVYRKKYQHLLEEARCIPREDIPAALGHAGR